jgi:hypothetical protein
MPELEPLELPVDVPLDELDEPDEATPLEDAPASGEAPLDAPASFR